MITFKAQIRETQVKADGKTNIKIRVSFNGKVRYLATEHNVKPNQFKKTEGMVGKHNNMNIINQQLRNQITDLENRCFQLGTNINSFDIRTLMDYLKNPDKAQPDFFLHMKNYIVDLRSSNRTTYADSIEQTYNKIQKFSPGTKLLFKYINYDFLMRFRNYLAAPQKLPNNKMKPGLKQNSINVHLRNIKTIFNDAIERDLVGRELYPFNKKMKIGTINTQNRNLDKEYVEKLIKVELENKSEQRALDLWLLSFYLLGINFKDILEAHKDQLKGDRLYYTRSKTHKPYSIKVFSPAMKIIKKYQGSNGMLLNVLEKKEEAIKKQDRKTPLYKDVTDRTNRLLKKIAVKCDIPYKISTYYARHSWASLADEFEIPKTVISLALGHANNTVTDTYIKTELNRVDEANEKILTRLGCL